MKNQFVDFYMIFWIFEVFVKGPYQLEVIDFLRDWKMRRADLKKREWKVNNYGIREKNGKDYAE